MEKLCLHLLLCFQDVSAQWSLPKELLKLTLSVACQVIGNGISFPLKQETGTAQQPISLINIGTVH